MKEPRAVSPAIFPSASPASSSPAPAGALTSKAPIAGEIPRPPAPFRKGDQLWPATAAAPASAPATGWSRPAINGPRRALGQLEHPHHEERPFPRHFVQARARNRATADRPQVHPGPPLRRDIGKRDGPSAKADGNGQRRQRACQAVLPHERSGGHFPARGYP